MLDAAERETFDDALSECDRLTQENAELKASLREMLEVYWAKGDRDEPPEFIQKAAKLADWSWP